MMNIFFTILACEIKDDVKVDASWKHILLNETFTNIISYDIISWNLNLDLTILAYDLQVGEGGR